MFGMPITYKYSTTNAQNILRIAIWDVIVLVALLLVAFFKKRKWF